MTGHRMRANLGAAVCVFFSVIGCGRAESPPKMVLDSLDKNIGLVWKGQPAKFDFLVKNAGGQPLDLDIKPGCGCTVANANKMTIPPGKEDHIIAILTTEHFSGVITKIVTVSGNDPEQKSVMLKITANVKPYVEVQPQSSQNFRIYKGDSQSFLYTLTSNDDTPLTVKGVSASSNLLTPKLGAPEKGADGRVKYPLEVALSPNAPAGNFSGCVTVETTHPKSPTVRIDLYGLIQQEITAKPSFIHFGNLKPGEKAVKDAKVSKRKGTFKITDAKADNSHVAVVVNTETEGKSYLVRLTFDGGLPKGDMNGKAVLTTDDPGQPQIIISFAVNITEASPTQAQ